MIKTFSMVPCFNQDDQYKSQSTHTTSLEKIQKSWLWKLLFQINLFNLIYVWIKMGISSLIHSSQCYQFRTAHWSSLWWSFNWGISLTGTKIWKRYLRKIKDCMQVFHALNMVHMNNIMTLFIFFPFLSFFFWSQEKISIYDSSIECSTSSINQVKICLNNTITHDLQNCIFCPPNNKNTKKTCQVFLKPIAKEKEEVFTKSYLHVTILRKIDWNKKRELVFLSFFKGWRRLCWVRYWLRCDGMAWRGLGLAIYIYIYI